jgi:hypothetical protein
MKTIKSIIIGKVTDTNIYQNHYKDWVAETNMLLDEAKRLQLRVSTSKGGSGSVRTSASVSVISEDGMCTTHALFSDFSKTIKNQRYPRATSKVVQEQHFKTDFDAVIAEAKAFYSLV